MLGLDNPLHIAFLLVVLLLVFGAKKIVERMLDSRLSHLSRETLMLVSRKFSIVGFSILP